MRPLFTAFFTPGTRYERHADALRQSLAQYGLECDFRAVADQGDWIKNTKQTAFHVCRVLADYPDRPVVQLDADCVCLKYPWLFEEFAKIGVDVAAHWRRNVELLNGCVYFGPTSGARLVAEKYRDFILSHPGCANEQTMLAAAIGELRDLVKVEKLPASYAFIADIMKDDLAPGEEVVFEMLQASREVHPSPLTENRRRRLAELQLLGIETP